jgi:hypothetical protein
MAAERVTLADIEEVLKQLPPEKLPVVLDFVTYLVERPTTWETASGRELMLATEDVLRKDWDTPEEDAAWAHL